MGLSSSGDVVLGPDTREQRPFGGIYAIRNTRRGRVYVGATNVLVERWRQHLSNLRHGRHVNAALQADFDSDGVDAFEFEVLQRVNWRDGRAALLAAERQALAGRSDLYNEGES
jgi:hypothetical protein